MSTFINTEAWSGYTDLDLDQTAAHLNAGLPIRCWWFSDDGTRYEETFIFTGYRHIRTDTPGAVLDQLARNAAIRKAMIEVPI